MERRASTSSTPTTGSPIEGAFLQALFQKANGTVADPTPEQLMQQALSAHRKGAIAEAKRLYELLLRIDPRNAAACGNLAIIAAQHGDLVGTEKLFSEGIRLRPDY